MAGLLLASSALHAAARGRRAAATSEPSGDAAGTVVLPVGEGSTTDPMKYIQPLAFSDDGTTLLTSGNLQHGMSVWTLATASMAYSIGHPGQGALLIDDSSQPLTVGFYDTQIEPPTGAAWRHHFPITNFQSKTPLEATSTLTNRAIAISHDGHLIATTNSDSPDPLHGDPNAAQKPTEVHILDSATGSVKWTLPDVSSPATAARATNPREGATALTPLAATFSGDGKQFAYLNHAWDVNVFPLTNSAQPTTIAVGGSSGKRATTKLQNHDFTFLNDDNHIVLRRPDLGAALAVIDIKADTVTQEDYSTILCKQSWEGEDEKLNDKKGKKAKKRAEIKNSHDDDSEHDLIDRIVDEGCLAVSPDGNWVVAIVRDHISESKPDAIKQRLIVVSRSEGKAVGAVPLGTKGAHGVLFSPDGSRIAFAAGDETIKVCATASLIKSLDAVPDFAGAKMISSVGPAPDGTPEKDRPKKGKKAADQPVIPYDPKNPLIFSGSRVYILDKDGKQIPAPDGLYQVPKMGNVVVSGGQHVLVNN